MDRVNPSRFRRRDEGRNLLLPGAEHWELWSLAKEGEMPPRQLSDFPGPAEGMAGLKGDSVLALPSRDALLIPLWLTGKDRSLFAGLAALQLEKRGLLGAGPDGAYDVDRFKLRVVAEAGERTLIAAALLAEPLPLALCRPRAEEYRLMPDLFSLPADQVILWRELGQWVFCLTRGQEPVFLHALPAGTAWEGLISEVQCALLTLEAEQVLSPAAGALAWTSPSEKEKEQWGRVLGLPLRVQPPPPPRLEAESRSPLPAQVRLDRAGALRERKKGLLIRALTLAYLLLVAGLVGNCAWLAWQKHRLRAELTRSGPTADRIRQTAGRWDALTPALMPDAYAVEILFRCTRNLPEDGLRLVSFSQDGQSLLLEGEAKSASLAFAYVESLKKDPDLADYAWEMLPPKLLSNNSAQFQIQGTSRYESPHLP